MASSKRSWEGNIVSSSQQKPANPKEPPNSSAMTSENTGTEEGPIIQSVFENFRSELDEHHDRRERIIKASRDITALSKKMYDPADTRSSYQHWTNLFRIAYSPYNGTIHTSYCKKPYPDNYITESERSTPPSRLTSPKKTKSASPKSSTFSKPSPPSSQGQTPGATNDKSPAESKNSSKPSPSNIISRPRASLRATKSWPNYRKGSS